MSKQAKIIWQEGMPLHPQHFQQQERYFQHLIQHSNPIDPAIYYGFQEYQLATPLLSLLRFTLERASGIFPDGTPFILDGDYSTAIVEPLSVPVNTVNQLIYLCLPLPQNQQAEAAVTAKPLHRYQSEVINLPDTHQDNGRETSVIIGKLNLQLRLEQDSLNDCTCFAVARIKHCNEQQGIVLDETFIPSVLNYQAVAHLHQNLQEIAGLLAQRIKALADKLARPSYQHMTDINEKLILQALNKHFLIWQHLIKHYQHPINVYLLALQLLGELATFTTDEKYWIANEEYQHSDLTQSFQPLLTHLRLQLNKVIESAAFALPLEKADQGWWLSPVLNTELIENNQFILAVKADMVQETLQPLFPGQAKLAAADQIGVLVRSQLPGLNLTLLPTIPPSIPYYSGFTYFTIEQQTKLWDNFIQCGQLAVHVAGQFPGLEMHCWAVKK